MNESSTPSIMFVFPGQGSQYLGMGSDIHAAFASARAIYDRASAAMGFDVARLSFEGPEVQLNSTEFTQIALLTHSVACLEAFRELTGDTCRPAVVAGHSLGEYSALVAAGALGFEDALKLIRMRGRLMSQYGRGQMIAFRLDLESIKPLADARYCGIGGCNLPEQTVVCGFESDLEALMEDVVAKFGQAKAGRYLKTEGAFHTYLMVGAAERFRPYLDSTAVQPPAVKVLSNYTGDYHADDPELIRASLFFQMFNPVKWMNGLQRAIDDDVNLVLEFGGGIGREQPGVAQTPASRKPNLEGITRKAYTGAGRRCLYLPAINLDSLKYAAGALQCLRSAQSASRHDAADGPVWIGERHYSLYLPMQQGVAGEGAIEFGALVQELGLAGVVRTILEEEADSLRTLQDCCDPALSYAEAYLEVIVGTTGAFLHFRGDEARRELAELRAALEREGRSRSAPRHPASVLTARSAVLTSGVAAAGNPVSSPAHLVASGIFKI